MSDITRKISIFGCLMLTSFCFWKAGTGLIGDADTEILPSAHAAMSPSITPSLVKTTPIQQMRPGMRVVGRNPLRRETEATIDPTPEGWRLVSVQMRKEDGTYFEAELLRPLSWIRQHQAQPGAVIELNMPELHVVGAAEVLAVSACPPIEPGDGPVVLSTFKNVAKNVLNIYVEGEAEPIGVTAGHPIWSEDRQAFIHSDQLQSGERLRSAVGRTVRITSIEIRAGPEPVYNLEVAGEHVYSVTGSGLLVHNVSDCDLVTKIGLPDGSYIDLNTPRGETNYVLFNKTHRASLPRPKGTGPNGGRLQSHHGLQYEWAKNNLAQYGYNGGLAPTVTLETGKPVEGFRTRHSVTCKMLVETRELPQDRESGVLHFKTSCSTLWMILWPLGSTATRLSKC